MKPRTLLPLAALAVGSWLAPAAQAEFNPAKVPADSKWVVYADFNALRETDMGQQLIAMVPVGDALPEGSPIQPNFAKILSAIGSITGFGSLALTPDNADVTGALVIEGTGELRKIAEGLIAHATVSSPETVVELTDLPIEAYQMHGEIVIGFPEEPIMLVGRSPEKLIEALNLYRGRGASLASGKHPLSSLLPGSDVPYYIYAASVVPSEALGAGDNTPQARVLQMTQSASITLGESDQNLVARATLESKDKALAEKLVKILNGLTAMLSLAESSDQDLTAFINSVRIRRQDQRVSLQMAYPTERLAAMVKTQVEEKMQPAAPSRSEGAATPAAPELEVKGEVLARWTADAMLGGDTPNPDNISLFTSEPVELSAGSILVVTGARHDGEHARVDYLDLIPVGGGDPVRYEAEFMRLGNYSIEGFRDASGGELIRVNQGRGEAQLRFHGPAGAYRVRVAYVDETDGQAPFALSVIQPANP